MFYAGTNELNSTVSEIKVKRRAQDKERKVEGAITRKEKIIIPVINNEARHERKEEYWWVEDLLKTI